MSIRLQLRSQLARVEWWCAWRSVLRCLPVIAAVAVMPHSVARAEYIALYDFTGSTNGATSAPSHDTYALSSASSITMNATEYSIRTATFGNPVPGVRVVAGANTANDLSAAVSGSFFMEFTVTPNSGYGLSASFFLFEAAVIDSSFDDEFTPFTIYAYADGAQVGSVTVASDAFSLFSFSLPTYLYTITTPVNFKLYVVDGGAAVDALAVDNIGVTTPEPASLAMLSTALMGLVFFRARRRGTETKVAA